MNSDIAISENSQPKLKYFRSSKSVIRRFVARRTVRSAIFWAIVFGTYVASKAIGFVKLYPTMAAREKIAQTFASNVGIEFILGKAPALGTTAAYVAWNTANIMIIIGSIWAFLLATKYFRGEEEAGRWEVMLAGQTTLRRSVSSTFAGLSFSLAIFYIVLVILLSAVGKYKGVDFSSGASLVFGLVIIAGIAVYMCLGALLSQLLPTRSKAASVTGTILAASFLLRAIGDITSIHWILYLTPLGWVEKFQPLANPKIIWLIPFLVLIVIMVALTYFFAGRRDYSESIISDRANSKPHFLLLKSPFRTELRLARANIIGWLSVVFIGAVLYGLITKSAAKIFSQSASFSKAINRLSQTTKVSSALAFLGIVFFLQMVIIMAYSASSITSVRRDEANGYLDNFLVRPVSRIRLLTGRAILTIIVLVLAALLMSLGALAGLASSNLGIPFHSILYAGINAVIPALFTLSVGIFAFGILPRLTSILAYGVLAWSFLIEMLSSGLKLNHWIVDSSILSHIAFAPATSPKWKTNLIALIISVILIIIGLFMFNRRDLEVE